MHQLGDALFDAVKWLRLQQLAYHSIHRTVLPLQLPILTLVARLSPSETNPEKFTSALARRDRFSLR